MAHSARSFARCVRASKRERKLWCAHSGDYNCVARLLCDSAAGHAQRGDASRCGRRVYRRPRRSACVQQCSLILRTRRVVEAELGECGESQAVRAGRRRYAKAAWLAYSPGVAPPRTNRLQFGNLLRRSRHRRAMTQIALAERAGVSNRHLSFLETGKAQPSRAMVQRLAAVLQVPLQDQNTWLAAAGYAPLYGERELGAPELEHARRALEFILRQQEPYPAIV